MSHLPQIAGSLLDGHTNIDKFESLLKIVKMVPEAGILCTNTSDVLQKSGYCARLLETCVDILKTNLMRDNLMDLFVNIEMKVTPIIAGDTKKSAIVYSSIVFLFIHLHTAVLVVFINSN